VKLGSFKELAHIEAQRRGAEVAKKVPLSMQSEHVVSRFKTPALDEEEKSA
jgi:hypothetical protein